MLLVLVVAVLLHLVAGDRIVAGHVVAAEADLVLVVDMMITIVETAGTMTGTASGISIGREILVIMRTIAITEVDSLVEVVVVIEVAVPLPMTDDAARIQEVRADRIVSVCVCAFPF
jgi:hypothetical protein